MSLKTPNPKAEALTLCALADMPDRGARGFELTRANGDRLDVIVWRDGDHLRGFINKCPHLGLPLETFPDRFLSADGRRLICSAHGAQFDANGACFAGPCKGQSLTPMPVRLDGQMIVLQAS